ncbi:MAG: M48 family metallopeptidase [Planctomycetaceae bacterium]|nr:M48 family metallopeptidase [Planctomycetaceae bacterium]
MKTATLSKPADPRVRQLLLESLEIELPKRRPSLAYFLSLMAVGLAMLLMPLLCLGLLSLLVYAIWWNWTYTKNLPAGQLAFYNYFIMVACAITLVFLVKPLIGRNGFRTRPVRLKREAEPFLYEYVEKVCLAVGAPPPTSIRVDCEANASAGYSHGFWGLWSNNMVLVIGLPLVAGMNVRQFTSILAHEFGHFSQEYGMRHSALIRGINHWLFTAAYARGSWDYKLANLPERSGLNIGLWIRGIQFCIWISRSFIAFISHLGHFISCHMSRQMEYDADRHAILLTGSNAYISTLKLLGPLSMATEMAKEDLSEFYRQERLADNIPLLANTNVPHIRPEWIEKWKQQEMERKTHWYDTHPNYHDRILFAVKADSAGSMQAREKVDELPAEILFDNFDKTCRASTLKLYEAVLGTNFRKSCIRDTGKLVRERDMNYEAGKALDRYFQVHIPIQRPLRLTEDVMNRPKSANATLGDLRQSRQEMLSHVDEYERLTKCLTAAESTWTQAAQAHLLNSVNLAFRPRDFGLTSNEREDVKTRLKQSSNSLQVIRTKMLPFEDAAEQRLSAALQLLNVPELIRQIGEGEILRKEIHDLIPTANLVGKLMTRIPDLVLSHRKLGVLVSRINKHSRPELFHSIEIQMRDIHNSLTSIHKEMGKHLYPTAYGEKAITFREYALPQVPEVENFFALFLVTQEACVSLMALQIRIFSKLAHAAERVETFVRLPQLPPRQTGDTPAQKQPEN